MSAKGFKSQKIWTKDVDAVTITITDKHISILATHIPLGWIRFALEVKYLPPDI